ncbi:MAG: VWA domain-containing protein [Deltaproteobacteria bacterium]|nr:VWA domain-containing protein [Deltaproteobacteria bacterium]
MKNLIFEDPLVLWIGIPFLVLWTAALFYFVLGKSRASVKFSQVSRLKQIKPSRTVALRKAIQLLRVIVIALLLVAAARPQTGRKESKIRTKAIDIMLVIDTSGSMKALDLDAHKRISARRNRLQVVKDVVRSFIKQREDDQIGLVVFGDDAYTQCPLTLDHGVLLDLLDRVQIGMAGENTALGAGLGTAVKRLKKSKAKSKVVVLLTDGRNNAGTLTPRKAAEVAKAFGIKVYTIGAGTRGQAPFIVDAGIFGKQVRYMNVEIDEDTLKDMAEKTGGHYYRATDADTLKNIYETINKLEKTEIVVKSYMDYDEHFDWFVIPAIVLLVLEIVLLGTRFRKVP